MEGWQQLFLDARSEFTVLDQSENPPCKIQITQSKIFRNTNFQSLSSTNEDLVKRRQTNNTLQLVRNFLKATILYENAYPEGFSEELHYTIAQVESSEIQNKDEILLLLNLVQKNNESKIVFQQCIDRIDRFATKKQEFPYLPCAELRFSKVLAKLNAKMLRNYSKLDKMNKQYQKIVLCFLLILSEVDGSLKFLTSEMNKRTIGCAKAYFSNPGIIIKNIRELPSLVRQNKINSCILKTIHETTKEDIELNGSIRYLYRFIKEFQRLFTLYKPLFNHKLTRNDTLRKPNGKSLSQDSAAIDKIIQDSNEIEERTDSTVSSRHKSMLLNKFISQSMANKSSKRFKENTQCPIEHIIRQRIRNKRRSVDREIIQRQTLVESNLPEDNIFNIII